MCEFFKWLVNPDNINSNVFGLITVVLSGFLSWLISALYFKEGNKNALRLNVLFPIKRILEEPRNWKNYKAIENLSKVYDSKYLKKNEQTILNKLLIAYKTVCTYNYSYVCAESLFSYFQYKLQQNGIETKPVPIIIENEIVDYEAPIDLLYLKDDLAKAVENYPPESNENNTLVEEIKFLYSYYCEKYYTKKEILYFDDTTFDDVLKKARIRNEWNEKLNNYKEAERNFLQMRVLNR